jgi:hypothetical protein
MPSGATIDVVLSWSRTATGTTAVLRQVDDVRWDELDRTDATEFTVRGLTTGRAYVFAAADVLEDGSLAPEDEWETLRVTPLGDDTAPALPDAPTGFAAAQDGANVNLQWDSAEDGITTGSELRVGTSWEDGTLVAADVTGASYAWPWWSSGEQTFHVKAVDRFGRVSEDAASATLTVEALGDHVTTGTSDQGAGGWPGTAIHLEPDAGALRLATVPLLGMATMPLGQATWSVRGTLWSEGSYETPVIDAGLSAHHRIEVDDAGVAHEVDPPALGDALGSVGQLGGYSLGIAARTPVDRTVEIDTSPTAAGAWDGWRPYVPGTYLCRRYRLRVTARGDGLRGVRLPRLVLRRRKFNRKDEGTVFVPGGVPIEVFFAAPFTAAPAVVGGIVGPNPGLGLTVQVTVVTAASYRVEVFDGMGMSVPATVAWHALGT